MRIERRVIKALKTLRKRSSENLPRKCVPQQEPRVTETIMPAMRGRWGVKAKPTKPKTRILQRWVAVMVMPWVMTKRSLGSSSRIKKALVRGPETPTKRERKMTKRIFRLG